MWHDGLEPVVCGNTIVLGYGFEASEVDADLVTGLTRARP